jgi:hypothetical protein
MIRRIARWASTATDGQIAAALFVTAVVWCAIMTLGGLTT